MYKKQLLETHQEYEDVEGAQCYGIVTVENLVFLEDKAVTPRNTNTVEYFVCLLHSGTKLIASDIRFPDEDGHITFRNPMAFGNLLSDFEIYVKVFSMRLKKNMFKVSLLSIISSFAIG